MATNQWKPDTATAKLVSETPSGRVEPHKDVNATTGTQHSPTEGPMHSQPDDAADLEQRKQILRAQFAVRPLRPEELRRQEDARWARQDPEVLAHYRGEFVVPYQRKIVAHGTDAAVVLAEAARLTGHQAEELSLVGLIDPLLDMPR
jgi:hypothetical protein